MVKRSIIACLIGLTVSCVSEDEGAVHYKNIDTNVTSRHAIKGGVNAPSDTSTVGMFNFGGGVCSGTLIAPNLVLTAQHCVARTATEYVICGQTTFGSVTPARQIFVTTQPFLTQNSRDYTGVAQVLVPEGSREMCGNDIALLVLSSNIPESQAVPLPPRIDEPLVRGEVYDAIGFGHIGDGSGAGVRRKITNRVVQCSAAGCPSYAQVTGTEFLGTEGTCQGDSGGTAKDSKGRVIGALSRGPNGCAASIYSDVFPWAEWIREVGAEAAVSGGYEPPLWVTHGLTELPEDDIDLDGVTIDLDNCPEIENPEQGDLDGDGKGDACDFNQDNDPIEDDEDNCPMTDNEDQLDFDNDGFGDACDNDDDDDGIEDMADYCPNDKNHFEFEAPCGSNPNDVVVLLNDDGGGCATATPTSLFGPIFAFVMLLGFRRRD